jgi:hypothetical protein
MSGLRGSKQGLALLLALLLGGAGAGVAEARGRDADEADEDEADEDEGDEDVDDADPDDDDDRDDDRPPDRGFQVDDSDIDREGDDDTEDDGDDEALVSEFEKDLFYVDKIDDRDTIDRTLLQGSFTSSSFFYRESGGALPGDAGTLGVSSASRVTRLFTDLRAQLAARHLGGGNWDVRLDGRVRLAADPSNASVRGNSAPFDVRSQAGAFGRNEYDLREATIARLGEKTTFVLGRQIVPELAATRVDGARLTLIRSEKLSLLGFGGLLPVRGSRSIGFDYPKVTDADGNAGRLLPMGGGLGAAYAVPKAYGSFGVVSEVPGKGEALRTFLTSTGYFRGSPQLDAYHYAVIDVVGPAGFAITNLSLGVDYRPRPRIRIGAQVNHVDTETLDIIAQRWLSDRDATGAVRNDVEIYRIASNEGRGAVSVALGKVEEMEVSTALTVRQRGEVPLTDGTDTLETLAASQSLEVWGQFVHRRLLGTRVGVDVSKILGLGEATFARSSVLSLRASAAREFMGGKAEGELILGYASASDDVVGTSCATVVECYGASQTSTLGVTLTGYYRLTDSLFGLAMLDVNRISSSVTDGTMTVADPGTLGLAGYLRLAYRY